MQLSLSKEYNNKIMKAIAEFNLINDGDRIMVGLSGGKDSLFLLYALRLLQLHMVVNFELAALTVDNGFNNESDFLPLKVFCQELNVEYHIIKTDILNEISENNTGNPCAKCSYLRKGVMADFIKNNGYNKLALGHHYDDAVATFLISTIYSGQLKTFLPKRYLSKMDIYIIRPLVYLREKKIKEIKKDKNLNSINNLCPYEKKSTRNVIRKKLDFIFNNKQIFYNIASAMRDKNNIELWPQKMSGEEILNEMNKLWGKY